MNKLLLTAFSATALLVGGSVGAQTLKMTPYLGATGGIASWNANCTGASNCKTNPASYRFFAGLDVAQNLAVELTAASLGTIKGDVTGGGLNIKGTSYDVSAVYKFTRANNPLGFFVKSGLAYTQGKATLSPNTATTNAWGLLVGGGATYALNDNFALRGELNTQKLKVPGSSGNVTSITVGGQGSF